MKIFNLAMLAKQCWRLLLDPSSLCYQVLKGRYFPKGDFWNSKNTRSASYTWRSIMQGKKLLQKGLVWRVGDGKNISIKEDNWIPEETPSTICTIGTVQQDQKVSSLIDDNNASWKEDKVREMFQEEIAEKILKIPISSEGCKDFASWPHSKNGTYTVKSGYNLARTQLFWLERSLTGRGSSSNQEIIEKVWKKLWKIQCPEKMKIVLWRIAQNCLPTGDQLQTRSIPTRYDCVFCNRSENVAHCFLLCHYVKEIWAELKIYFDFSLNLSNFVHIEQWLLDWILNASDYQSVVFAVAAWHIWENRNNTRNGSEMVHPSRIVDKPNGYWCCHTKFPWTGVSSHQMLCG
nr:uncharacterized protein LOC127313744 [Lolium perenne]